MQATLRAFDKRHNPSRKMDLRPGYTVKVHQKISEGEKERIQIFEGLVIKVKNRSGVNHSITVRKISSGIGVEKVIPVNGANISKIQIVKKAKIRRAKLYYMRGRTGKKARLSERLISAGEEGAVVNIQASEAELEAQEAAAKAAEAEKKAQEKAEAEAKAAEEKTKAEEEAKAKAEADTPKEPASEAAEAESAPEAEKDDSDTPAEKPAEAEAKDAPDQAEAKDNVSGEAEAKTDNPA